MLVQAGTEDLQDLVRLSQTSPLLAWYIYTVSQALKPHYLVTSVSSSRFDADSRSPGIQDNDRPSLWRRIHNNLYDDPRRSVDYQIKMKKAADGRVLPCEWQDEVTARYRAGRVLRKGRIDLDDVKENASNVRCF